MGATAEIETPVFRREIFFSKYNLSGKPNKLWRTEKNIKSTGTVWIFKPYQIV